MQAIQGDGLFDLQVNGYAGVDFNDDALTAGQLDHALEAMLANGVTGCLPTLITAAPDVLAARFAALDAAVRTSRLGAVMVPGYHLEGPFLNAEDGYFGCHPRAQMTDPDIALVARLEQGLSRPILMITLAPERRGAIAAAAHWRAQGKTLAVGHSAADFACIEAAVGKGVTLSTHLGNGLPQVLPKLDNTLLAQLAQPGLTACLIADGVHVPKDALRALISLKGYDRCVLVTDAMSAAAMPPGTYTFANVPTVLQGDGRVTQEGGRGLAGSALRLDQAVRNVVDWNITAPKRAIAMASVQARATLSHAGIAIDLGVVAWNSAMEPAVIRLPSTAVARGA
ncbi:N-acetylglucosamine-6-phosphate deacetylase [Paracoccus benzoatiresistens]|uniref:N-acetylglucosamine-6-phosphate deacetylase n=1 Tax=Paracoccus benzoatiresistens TaxID=2997341 RepID=A0ABT4JA67_9RHOB|nr:hypothetical protein [Paracoccus sp. EF6]MCZ0964026.1 hypothetical protein [Paracoccus sp. EF6]